MTKKNIIDPNLLSVYLHKNGVESDDAAVTALTDLIQATIELYVGQQKNRSRIAKIDSAKSQMSARDSLSSAQLEKLPSWVKDDLENAVVIGSSGQVVQISNGKKYHLGNSLNDLSGGEWTYFLNSVISTRYPTSGTESYAHHIRKVHPSPKPPQLMQLIIEFFTKENEIVLDFFMGVGGTLLGASLANRRAIGIDLSESYVKVYQEASLQLGLKTQEAIVGNSIEILRDRKVIPELLGEEKISLIAIDPPYGDMMNRAKTGEAVKKGRDASPTPFTDSVNDLGNLDISEFYAVLRNSVVDALPLLKLRGHVVVFIKDFQPDGSNTNLLHARVIEDLNAIPGLQYLGMKIWADQSVNLYPYGYPYSYVANQIHQYIMIFRKVN